MGLDTAIIMIVGVVALLCLRFVLSRVGRDFKGDHTVVKTDEAATVYRQAGRNRHLLAPAEPVVVVETPPV